MIQISVIIPTRDRAEDLKIALDSLAAQSFPRSRFEILVVNNGSTDHTKEIVHRFGQRNPDIHFRCLDEATPGQLSGRHKGAFEAEGDILAYLDDDVIVADGWMEAIHASFLDPEVHFATGPCVPEYEAEPPTWLEHFWKRTATTSICEFLSLIDLGDKEKDTDPMNVWGLNFAVRRDTFFELGGFHPDCIPDDIQYLQGDGESGLVMKASKIGLRARYNPKAKLWHRISENRLTLRYFRRRAFYQGVCDSYTQIRNTGKFPSPLIRDRIADDPQPPQGYRARAKAFTRRIFGLKDQLAELAGFVEQFNNAYLDGFKYHQKSISDRRELLNWVHKDNYLDYTLPEIDHHGETRRKERATVRNNHKA